MTFYTTLKGLVSLSKEDGYIHLDEIDWNDERLHQGMIVKLKKVPFKVKLQASCTNGDVDWVITNDLAETVITQSLKKRTSCVGEEFHRELKQLTGTAKCQCRKARSQRNHLACCYHAWLSLKIQATLLNAIYAFALIYSAIICEPNFATRLSRLFSQLAKVLLNKETTRMKVKAVDHLAVTVSDTERALEFYVGKLGLRQVEQHQLEGEKCDMAGGMQGSRAQSTRLAAPDTPHILLDLLEFFEPPNKHVTPMGSVAPATSH